MLIGVMALAGCFDERSEEASELRQEMAVMTKDLRGRIDPLPQVRERIVMPLEFGRDPFARN